MAMPAEQMPAQEPSADVKDPRAKKAIEDFKNVLNFTYEDYEAAMDDYNKVLAELQEKFGQEIGADVLDTPLAQIGALYRELDKKTFKGLMDYLSEEEVMEVNKKWGDMTKSLRENTDYLG